MANDPEKERKHAGQEQESEPVQWQRNEHNDGRTRDSRDVETDRQESADAPR